MSDERTSPTPTPPRCPVCATGFTGTSGGNCPTGGRRFAARPVAESDFRRKIERFRLDGPDCVVLGVVLSGVAFLLSIGAPGLLIPLAMLLVAALVRTARLLRGSKNGSPAMYFAMFFASLGVSLLMGVAAGAACLGACLATEYIGPGFMTLVPGYILGGIPALVVFAVLFVALWPRGSTSSKYDPGED